MSFCNDNGIPHSKFLKWDQSDQQKAIAWSIESSLICQLCGTAEWEWDENRFAYVPHSRFCKGCYIKEASSEDAGKMPGTTTTLIPNTDEVQIAEYKAMKQRQKMDLTDQPPLNTDRD